jgi:fibro-slime domain-containing protein
VKRFLRLRLNWNVLRDVRSPVIVRTKTFQRTSFPGFEMLKTSHAHISFVLLSLAATFAAGCSASGADDGGGAGGTASGSGSAPGSGGGLVVDGSGGGGTKPPATIYETLPEGFTAETTAGGWKVLGALADFEEPKDNSCANVLRVVMRDFTQAHIDFGQEKPASFAADGKNGLYLGLVESQLGSDRKPVQKPGYSPADVIENFSDWYVNTPGVNDPYVVDIWLQPKAGAMGTYIFDSNSFFPIDAYNLHPADVQNGGNDGGPHNFLFTTEMHTAFKYGGGEVFNFRGDDDVFVFINKKLAVDIGGIHGPFEGNVDLDAQAATLGLTIGEVYDLDLFQAERNPGGSNFRIETSLDFEECGILPGDVK